MYLTALLLTAFLGGFAGPTLGQRGPLPPLQPTDYRSASGNWVLHVDPRERYGAGVADYRLSRGGRPVWAGELKVTLRDVVVTEDGAFGGYAYSRGPEARGSFCVLVVRADGEVLCDERTKRRPTNVIHGTPNPRGAGVHLLEASGVLVVRMFGVEDVGSEWRCYRMSDGERLPDLVPEKPLASGEEIHGVLDVESVAGTDLSLLKWRATSSDRHGTVFSLVDASGATLWRSAFVERRQEDRNGRGVSVYADIVPVDEENRFSYSEPNERQRVDCVVAQVTGGGWEVQELGHVPLEEAPEEEPLAEPRPIELAYLGATDLGAWAAADRGPAKVVIGLGFTDDAHPELIARRDDVFWFLSLDEDGRVADEIRLVPAEEGGTTSWHDSIGDRWFRAYQTYADEPYLRIDGIDVRSGAIVVLHEDRDAKLNALENDGRGGFVLLSTADTRLAAFDENGDVRWSWSKDDGPESLPSAKDMTVTGDAVVTVSQYLDLLQVYALEDGTLRGAVDLRDAWNREPRYPADVLADGLGGVYVADDERLWRTGLDGSLLQVVEPHLPDGQEIYASRFRARSDGSLWGWNQRWGILFELEETGVARPFGGRLPEQDELSEPKWVAAIDHAGRIFVQDSATGGLHAFDHEGRRTFVCRPEPNDFRHLYGLGRVAFDAAGHIYVPTEGEGLFYGPRHVRFDERGRRLGFEDLGSDEVRFVPGSDERWVDSFSHQGLVRKGSSAKTLQKILRRPDRRWFAGSRDFDVGPDGSVVVTDWPREVGDFGLAVCLYDADGGPRFLSRLGAHGRDVTLSREWIALHDQDTAYLLRIGSSEWRKLDLAPDRSTDHRWRLGFSPDGKELWALEIAEARLHRWALPD